MQHPTSLVLSVLGGVLLAGCGGGGDPANIDAAGGDVDATTAGADAAPAASGTIDLGDGAIDLPFQQAYLYTFDGTTSLVFGASTTESYDCFQVPGCVAIYVTLPEDAPLGDLTCETPGTQVMVQTDAGYFASSPLAGFTGGAVAGCSLTLDARGPIGSRHALSGLTATLLTDGIDVPTLLVNDAAIETVRGPDQAPKL